MAKVSVVFPLLEAVMSTARPNAGKASDSDDLLTIRSPKVLTRVMPGVMTGKRG